MLAVLDCKFPIEAETALIELGHLPLRLPPHPLLPPPVASHPDMLLFFASDAVFCTQSYAEIAKCELRKISEHLKLPIRTVKKDYGAQYPSDVLLNAAPIGSYLLCSPKAVAPELVEGYGDFVLPVRQGYTKCSVLPIGNHALITSDSSIASVAMHKGLDVLQISPGHIRLDGYNYGFIGGCTSFLPYKDTDTVYTCGALSAHPDATRIIDFCKQYGYCIRSLGTFPLTDVGTIFLI